MVIARYDHRLADSFINLLLECTAVESFTARANIVGRLRKEVRHHYTRSDDTYMDVKNLVKRCMDVDFGVEELVDAIRIYEGASADMNEVYWLIPRFCLFPETCRSHEAMGAVLVQLSESDISTQQLTDAYHRSLPNESIPRFREPSALVTIISRLIKIHGPQNPGIVDRFLKHISSISNGTGEKIPHSSRQQLPEHNSENRKGATKPIFISYSREDEEIARRLYKDLTLQGINVWIDVEHLIAGQRWRNVIPNVIRNASRFITLLSRHSTSEKGYFQAELKIALDVLDEFPFNGIYLIPVRLDDCQLTNVGLEDIHCIDLFPDYHAGLNQILKALGSGEKG